MLKICITGHRDLVNMKSVKTDIINSLKYFKQIDNNLIAISAVAAGADILFADAALSLQIPLQVILPFDLDEYKKDFSGPDLHSLERILHQTTYKIVQEGDIKNPETRNKAYLETGQMMVEDSDIVLAVWDGKQAAGTGGTGDIVTYAISKKKELHVIKVIRKSHRGELTEPDEILETFDKLDREAIKYKKQKFERAWVTGIITGLVAVFSFAIKQAFPQARFLFTVIEFTFLIISFVSLAVYAKKWKSIFLQKRRNAEYLRAVIWYRNAGIPIPQAEKIEYKPGTEILDIEKKIAAGIGEIKNIPNAKRIAWCLAQEQIDYHKQLRIKPFEARLE